MRVQDKLRACHTQRWSIVNTSRQQTVAEHSWAVAVIADEICDWLNVSSENWAEVRRMAIYHDVAEAILGDIPTPTKRKIGIGLRLKDLETGIFNLNIGNRYLYRIVKWADKIEAYAWIETNGVGAHAAKIAHRLGGEIRQELADETDHALKKAVEKVFRSVMYGDVQL